MKKKTSFLMRILATSIIVVMFAACGGKSGNAAKIVGTWRCEYNRDVDIVIFYENNTGVAKVFYEGSTSAYSTNFTYQYDNRNDVLVVTPVRGKGGKGVESSASKIDWQDDNTFYMEYFYSVGPYIRQ